MYFCIMKQKLLNIILVLGIIVLLILIGILGCYLYRQYYQTKFYAQQFTSVNSDRYDEIAFGTDEEVAECAIVQ